VYVCVGTAAFKRLPRLRLTRERSEREREGESKRERERKAVECFDDGGGLSLSLSPCLIGKDARTHLTSLENMEYSEGSTSVRGNANPDPSPITRNSKARFSNSRKPEKKQ